MKLFYFLQFLEISKCTLSFALILCRIAMYSMEQNVLLLRMPVYRQTPFRTTGLVSVESWGRSLRSAECLSRLFGIYWCGGNEGGWVSLFFNLLLSLSTACSWLDGNSTVNCFAN
jgi:hypothetical protein